MQRSIAFASILVLCGLLAAAWWLLSGGEPPPLPTTGLPVAEQPLAGTATAAGDLASKPGGEAPAHREAVATRSDSPIDDPEIRAGLCGFKGRVVDHKKVPVADTGVRIYRGAMDSILPVEFDLFAAESTYEPNYVAGETRTAPDGTWQVTGVWPRAIYLLFAGLGSDAPAHQIVTKVPSPGEIVDLGDIELPDAAVITGTVVGEDGEALAGALVRAADLPGAIAALFPFERFDPDGALLIRERGAPVRVVPMPGWVKVAFDQLPIPTTRTTGDGSFRLVGVVPGSNMLATTARDHLSDVKPSVPVRAGQEKDVGKIRMKRGEELTGKVVDTAGKPVANAEIFAGSTLSIAPVDIAQRLANSDAEGRFTGQGFSAGKVTVAARRDKSHSWVLAEPQPILGDVVVTLPATFAVDVAVTQPDGTPIESPRLQLLHGKPGDGAIEMKLLGFAPPVDLKDRLRVDEQGRRRIENLSDGDYVLLADAPGMAVAHQHFQITGADTSVALQLHPPRVFTVRVLTVEDKPIRNAAIYAEARGNSPMDMPVMCGRTKADGALVIDKLPAESVRVSADHPRWGVVHGEVKAGEELLLRMQPPGALKGVLRENGKAPPPAKYTVGVIRRRGDDARGPIETVPILLTPDLEGAFAIKALQPGKYEVSSVPGIDALRSPGGVMAMAQEAMLMGNQRDVDVQIVSGQTAEVVLETGEEPITGPTARVSGSVTVDGKVGAGCTITAYGNRNRAAARVDDRGRFDLGVVPAGHLWISVNAGSTDSMIFGNDSSLWSSSVELKEGEVRELTIDVLTSSISGVCVDPEGRPKGGVYVQANGKLKGTDRNRGDVWIGAPTNAEGEFRFPQVAEGTWKLDVRGNGGDDKDSFRGSLADIQVTGGVPVTGLRIELKVAPVVKGRVDLSAAQHKDAQWLWLGFHRLGPNDAETADGDWAGGDSVDKDTGQFSTNEIEPGRYRVQLWVGFRDDKQNLEYSCGVVVVPEGGVSDLQLRATPKVNERR